MKHDTEKKRELKGKGKGSTKEYFRVIVPKEVHVIAGISPIIRKRIANL